MNFVRNCWHVFASIRLAGNVKVILLQLGEKLEKLQQGLIQVACHLCLVCGIAFVFLGKAETWILNN